MLFPLSTSKTLIFPIPLSIAMNSISFTTAFVAGDLVIPRRRNLSFSYRRSSPAVVMEAARSSSAPAEAGKRPPRGITKPKPVSPALQAMVGVKEIPRTQALKQIWAYIKENNLQDPADKKVIVCDEMLKTIFAGRDRVGFLEVSKLLNPHFEK